MRIFKNKKFNVAIIISSVCLVVLTIVTVLTVHLNKSFPVMSEEMTTNEETVTQHTIKEVTTETTTVITEEITENEADAISTSAQTNQNAGPDNNNPIESTTKNITTATAQTTAAKPTQPATTVAVQTTSAITTTAASKPTIFNCGTLSGSYSATHFEKAFFDAINQKRNEAGLSQLKWNEAAHTMAAVRAKESISSWSHTRPNGTNKSTVLDDFGLASIPMGENLSKGGQLDDDTITAMVEGLMNSSGHRANILNPQATYSAVAAVTDSSGKVYVCQLFIVA